MTKLEINNQWGFYGTVKSAVRTNKATQTIWDTMVKRMTELYPEYGTEMVYEMLNSPVGRHLADDLLDMTGKPMIAVICVRIMNMNRLSLAPWWSYYKNARKPMPKIDLDYLYRTALKSLVHVPEIHEAMKDALGPGQTTPESWLNSEEPTLTELQLMWACIEKQSKGLTNDNA